MHWCTSQLNPLFRCSGFNLTPSDGWYGIRTGIGLLYPITPLFLRLSCWKFRKAWDWGACRRDSLSPSKSNLRPWRQHWRMTLPWTTSTGVCLRIWERSHVLSVIQPQHPISVSNPPSNFSYPKLHISFRAVSRRMLWSLSARRLRRDQPSASVSDFIHIFTEWML